MDRPRPAKPAGDGPAAARPALSREVERDLQHAEDLLWKLARRIQAFRRTRAVRAGALRVTWSDEAHIDTRIAAGDPLAPPDAIRDTAGRLVEVADSLERRLGLG